MKKETLDAILEDHKGWLADRGGVPADLRKADLREADLRKADLRRADLRGADLREADLDFSCLPLWCGSVGMKIDDRLAKQFLYHAMCNLSKEQMEEFLSNPIKYANGFHRVESEDVKRLED